MSGVTDLAALLARDWRDELGNVICRHGQIIAARRVEIFCRECRAEGTQS